jgi:hypothetical protein
MERIYGVPILDLKVIPERYIVSAARDLSDNPNNSFNILLSSAEEFRDAGLTPIFLTTPDQQQICVTTRERLEKKYHS